MNHIILNTNRTEMRFPLHSLTPQMIVETIADRETIQSYF